MRTRTVFASDSQCRTQMHLARRGTVTPEMQRVAEREQLAPEIIRDEVARGRMIIPANVHHAALDPMAIGLKARVKINANIGNSPTTSSLDEEVAKLRLAERWGADTVMDLSTGKRIEETRAAILDVAEVPIGTVPIYEAMAGLTHAEELTIERLLEVIERQARQGVDYMTRPSRRSSRSAASTTSHCRWATGCGRAASPTRPMPRSSRSSTRSAN